MTIKIDRVSTTLEVAAMKIQAAVSDLALTANSPEGKEQFESWILSVLKMHVSAVAMCIRAYAKSVAAGKPEEGMGMVGLHLQGLSASLQAVHHFAETVGEPAIIKGTAQDLKELDG